MLKPGALGGREGRRAVLLDNSRVYVRFLPFCWDVESITIANRQPDNEHLIRRLR